MSNLNQRQRNQSLKKKIRSGGFVFAEFAIALPLLILLMYGLARVSINIFHLGREQLADYVLETEAHNFLEMITQEARAAKTIDINVETYDDKFHKLTIIYHTVDEKDRMFINDTWATRVYIPHRKKETEVMNLYRERQYIIPPKNPITGENYFGVTQINSIKYEQRGKILHIALEMESLSTHRKIKLNTAVFMPACEEKNS